MVKMWPCHLPLNLIFGRHMFRKLVHRVLQGDRGNISADRYRPSELLSEKAIMDVFLQLKPTFPW